MVAHAYRIYGNPLSGTTYSVVRHFKDDGQDPLSGRFGPSSEGSGRLAGQSLLSLLCRRD